MNIVILRKQSSTSPVITHQQEKATENEPSNLRFENSQKKLRIRKSASKTKYHKRRIQDVLKDYKKGGEFFMRSRCFIC